jgi:hypothetical protein
MIDWRGAGLIGKRTRSNHAVEHATITILSSRIPSVVMRGRSNRNGFYVTGDLQPEDIEAAARDAVSRLRAGESELAIHPFCGTNLAVTGTMAGVAAAVATRLNRRSGTYAGAVLAALLAVMVSQPVGLWAQKYITTESNVGGLSISRVEEKRFFGRKLHFVRTTQ